MRLEGRSALVTGGARGIGAAIARRLAAEGAEVMIGDIDDAGAAEVAAEIGAEAVRLDVADPESAGAAVDSSTGRSTILVNNAGTDDFGFFTDMTPARWRRLLAINLEGVFTCTHAALPAMQERGYGRIVNIASEAGRVGSKGSAVYSAAKGGVIAFTKTIARENARFGVTANAIAPGPIDTPLLRGRRARRDRRADHRDDEGPDPAAPARRARRGRGRGRLPRLRRRLVRNRRDARRLRRPRDGLMAPEPGIERIDEFMVEDRLSPTSAARSGRGSSRRRG